MAAISCRKEGRTSARRSSPCWITTCSSSSLILIVLVSAVVVTVTNAFVVPRPIGRTTSASASTSTTLLAAAGAPIITEWKVLGNGRVTGTVKNHPAIDDGDIITTSPLADPTLCKTNGIVVTKSGSQYRLAQPAIKKEKVSKKNGAAAMAMKKKNGVPAKEKKSKPAPVVEKKKKESIVASIPKQSLPLVSKEKQLQMDLAKARIDFNLNGQIVGTTQGSEYVLAGKARRSTSGKSSIWTGYKVDDETGMPIGDPLTVKISNNAEALKRETDNYNKAAGLLGRGGQSFVSFVEYLRPAGKRPPLSKQVAIVMQQGDIDLKAYLAENGALTGKSLREAAVAAVQCLQALHGAGLVWTDLKTENFVVMKDSGNKLSFKGIDLESAMPQKDNPVDYSPEACPPEFAVSFLEGQGPYFILETSYDIWSLGMMLQEMATGKCMFAKKSPSQITKLLREDDFCPNLNAVEDEKLQDLISKCLQLDPKKRPSMTAILLHPYFLTTGLGPLSF